MTSPIGLAPSSAEAAAVSCVEQPPLCFRKLALMAYHISDVRPENKTLLPIDGAGPHARTLVLERKDRAWLWTAQMTAEPQAASSLRCPEQTTKLFAAYSEFLRSQDSTLLGQSVRTWVFVHDVDRHYRDMVDARRELFLKEGLTPETHYIVSTGIEGRTANPGSLVTLDAVAEKGLAEDQLVFIDRLDHLNRTDEYGVTFERAARLDHADRSHVYIAGTASIDSNGRVLYEGNILRQVERTIENVSALLEAAKASLEDVAAMIVYLRDGADAERVTAFLDRLNPTLPFTTVRAPVCRPTWLVEIEALAIVPNSDSRWPAF
jgi:enamine deaminase RidA (YjgF/YER057c/UK114 family)